MNIQAIKSHRLILSFLFTFWGLHISCHSEKVPVVGDVLKQFDEVAKSTVAQATRSGDALTVRAGNEMELLVENLMIQFDDRYKVAIRDLNIDEQRLIDELATMQGLIAKGVKTISRTQELLNLDLIEFTNRFSLITKKVPFYISSINGISIGQSERQHALEIVGIGFGYSTDAEKYLVDLEINGQKLPTVMSNRHSDKELVFSVPESYYSSFYNDSVATFIPAKFMVHRVDLKRSGKVKKERQYSVDFTISVLPKYYAKLYWEEVINKSQPKDTLTHDMTNSVAASETKSPNDWTQSWESPIKTKIWKVEFPIDPVTGANVSCTGSGCGFCYSPDGGYGVSYFTDNGRNVTVRRHCDGPPCQLTHRVYYIEYKDTSIVVRHDSLKVKTNEPIIFDLSTDNANYEYTISGRDFVGRWIYLDNSSQPQGAIRKISATPYAGHFRVIVEIGDLEK